MCVGMGHTSAWQSSDSLQGCGKSAAETCSVAPMRMPTIVRSVALLGVWLW